MGLRSAASLSANRKRHSLCGLTVLRDRQAGGRDPARLEGGSEFDFHFAPNLVGVRGMLSVARV